MRKLLTIVIFFLLTNTAQALDGDKHLHANTSAVLGGFSVMAVDLMYPDAPAWKKFVGAVGLSLIPGLVKEATDDHFDWQDMKYNAIGAVTGTTSVMTFTWRW